jgi:creatinine amidohydrolase
MSDGRSEGAARFDELTRLQLRQRTGELLAPTARVGISGHHLPFGGTLTAGAPAYIDLLVDLVVGLRQQGFARVLFVNGHGGNDAAMRVAVERLALVAEPHESAAAVSYWQLIGGAMPDWAPAFPVPGHAGAFETSIMLALHPHLVQAEHNLEQPAQPLATREVPGLTHPRPGDWASSGGRTDGIAPDAVLGARLLDALGTAFGDLLLEHLKEGQ